MDSKISILASLLSVLFVNIVNSTQSCRTPEYTLGECKPIEECPSLRSATVRIEGQFDIEETNRYLKNSACKSTENLVCCGNEKLLKGVLNPLENAQANILPDPDTCGISRTMEAVAIARIVGGFNVTKGQFPWMVALGYEFRKDQIDYVCGGSLITPNHILTAGHCVSKLPLIQVIIGILDINENPYLTGKVVQSYIHENYSDVTNINDIAVLKVQWKNSKGENVNFIPSNTAGTICLPKSEALRKNSFERYNPFISGWGIQAYDQVETKSATLLALQVPVTRNSLCKSKYSAKSKKTIITNDVLCAGYAKEKRDSCQGDSGGPLMLPMPYNGELRYYQIGIVSKGYKCGDGVPGIYTRVGNFIDWIVSKIDLE